MRIVLCVLGVLIAIVGVIFFFQGIGVIGGSFMTGEAAWAVIGAVGIFIGAWLVRTGIRWQPAAPLEDE